MIRAVAIHSVTSFSVGENTLELTPDEPGYVGDSGRAGLLTDRLADMLYRRLYCRPQRAVAATSRRTVRSFVERLSEANCGRGTWEPGWVIHAVENDGALVVHKQTDDLTLWAQPEQFRPRFGAVVPGAAGRLQVGKELREMLPGYYVILGDADQEDPDLDSPLPMVRFYWHLTVEGAELWVRELTARFNKDAVPFHAKLHSDPAMFVRADAAVLYVSRSEIARAMTIVPRLHATVARHLRSTTPMFTKRLARGLGVAEDPGDGKSFGQHRCRLIAEALIHNFEAGGTSTSGAMRAVLCRFTEEGFDMKRPWLNPGSQDLYAWPSQRNKKAQRRT